MLLFFFFKQKTAYEMRISDWSSDVCSSDLRTESGDVQVMSAGTGIRHSEYNHEDVETRIFQIWIIPTRTGDEPAWGSKPFPKGDRSGQFITLASGFEEDGDALPIRTDRSEEHTSELQSLMRISYAVFCLKKKTRTQYTHKDTK